MKKITKLLMVLMFAMTSSIFAQTITGTVNDENGPLPGANVIVKGTTNGTTSDFDGKFSLTVAEGSGTAVISFIGYKNKEINYTVASGEAKNLGTITLQSDNTLDEIVVTATSFAVDRKTPVAVSTIRAVEIENKLGTQEFPEILKSTPGIYATKSGGGFGDGDVTVRGFGSVNVAVMINGVPVNDMENGRVFWSNWAGLGDVTSAMQVQRGLGASKIAVPAIGGTINVITKTTDAVKGGNVLLATGNDNYQKYGITLSTGMMENGFAATISAARITGDGYVDGTEFEGANYFVSIAKQLNDNHKLSITSFGAPQRHGQRQNRSTLSRYRDAESGIKFNPDWGYKNGQVTHVEDNFYHKSQTSLNHEWIMSDNSFLSTALYASWGTGGGGGTAGSNRDLFNIRVGGDDQPIDLDNIVEVNRANGAEGSEAILRASRNDHSWFGLLSTFKTDLSDNLAFTGGVDLRTYTGKHFREITDLLGGQYLLNSDNVNNPNAALTVGDKFSYNNDGQVGWQGVFTQFEYDTDQVSAFVAFAASNTSYQRIDYFQYTPDSDLRETDKFNFFGYSAKGGLNYRLNDYHNVFANVGYFEKAADFDAVFQNFNNETINENAENQKIFSAEIGYGLRTEKLAANINIYRTEWNDRTLTRQIQNDDGSVDFANILGVNALHQGIEVDFEYRPSTKVRFNGMVSLGNWEWANDVENVQIFNEEQELIETVNLFIAGLKVGASAQTTAALGMDLEVFAKTNFTVDYNYFGDLYSNYDPNNRGEVGPQAYQLPNYSTFDASIRHGFKIMDLDATIIGRMNNVFNVDYIQTAFDGTASTIQAYYGFGRTFNISAKIKF